MNEKKPLTRYRTFRIYPSKPRNWWKPVALNCKQCRHGCREYNNRTTRWWAFIVTRLADNHTLTGPCHSSIATGQKRLYYNIILLQCHEKFNVKTSKRTIKYVLRVISYTVNKYLITPVARGGQPTEVCDHALIHNW